MVDLINLALSLKQHKAMQQYSCECDSFHIHRLSYKSVVVWAIIIKKITGKNADLRPLLLRCVIPLKAY